MTTHHAIGTGQRPPTHHAAHDRAASHARLLADLFGRRPDLEGVYSPADLAAEAVRWSA